jgi:purine-binding chemotaxis protein CheW
VGLIVDAANEVLKIDSDLIEPPPNVFEQGELNYVTGVGKVGGKLVILINMAKIMEHGDLRRITEFAEMASKAAAAR